MSERLPDGRFASEHRPPSGLPASRKERPPFQPGHALRQTHAAYRDARFMLSESPEVRELAAAIWQALPIAAETDALACEQLAVILTRQRRALAWIEQREAEGKRAADKLLRDLHRWTTTAHRLMESLGLTPRSRLALGIDLARGRDELARHLAEHYGDGDAEAGSDGE